jgi:hypothetical protein
MNLRSAHNQSTVPVGVGVLGGLAVATGWLVLQGLPFELACVIDVALVVGAVFLLVPHRPR